LELLTQLQSIPGPSGDEGRIADFVEKHCAGITGVTVRRVHDLVLATRGEPKVAVFAHIDTIGFTQAYDRLLFPLGGPKVEGGERIRSVDGKHQGRINVRQHDGNTEWRLTGAKGEPGMRWVYAAPLKVKRDQVSGPYLDNRAGVWNALRVLERCDNVAVVFTPNEEHTGRGALLGARMVYNDLGITRALISDITWHTKWVKQGKGPAISLRDRVAPRQRFLDEVIALAEESGLPFQREVEKDGGSDGSLIERSTFPIDWVFIGAPQKRTHTPRESCRISDLWATVELYCALIPRL
jgi:putative aminopeptidase FrvX